MERRTRAFVEGGVVLVATAVAAVFVSHEASDLVMADVVMTQPVEAGTTQLQLLIRGGGCAPVEDRGRPAKIVRKRIDAPRLTYTDEAIIVVVKVHDPRRDRCPGLDPGVPHTLTLPTPVGDRRILDGTRTPPVPMRLGAPYDPQAARRITTSPTPTPR
jgi:hypothetical protein